MLGWGREGIRGGGTGGGGGGGGEQVDMDNGDIYTHRYATKVHTYAPMNISAPELLPLNPWSESHWAKLGARGGCLRSHANGLNLFSAAAASLKARRLPYRDKPFAKVEGRISSMA